MGLVYSEGCMRSTLVSRALIAAMLLIAATSRSDVADSIDATAPAAATPPVGTGVPASAEPTTAAPVMPAPGAARPPKDPFSPDAIGPGINDTSPKPYWDYADLTAAEKAVVDAGRDTAKWDAVHSAYSSAAAEMAHRAASASASSQIGVDNLAGIGVVP